MLALRRQNYQLAESHLRSAIKDNLNSGSPAWTATARLDLVNLMLSRNDPGDLAAAQRVVYQALDDVKDLGVVRVEKKAEHLLRRITTATSVRLSGERGSDVSQMGETPN